MVKLEYYWAKAVQRLKGRAILNSSIDRTARIGFGSQVINTSIGRYSYCGKDCQLICSEIGSFCSISDNVTIGGANHPITWVSTSPVFYDDNRSSLVKIKFSMLKLPKQAITTIGNDVWIGKNVLIKQGIRIGNGAIIGMGSVVTKDIEDYIVVAGNPAKKIKDRFSAEIKIGLEKSSWWEKDNDWLLKMSHLFNNPEHFIAECYTKEAERLKNE